jgi:hypothetical protein
MFRVQNSSLGTPEWQSARPIITYTGILFCSQLISHTQAKNIPVWFNYEPNGIVYPTAEEAEHKSQWNSVQHAEQVQKNRGLDIRVQCNIQNSSRVNVLRIRDTIEFGIKRVLSSISISSYT